MKPPLIRSLVLGVILWTQSCSTLHSQGSVTGKVVLPEDCFSRNSGLIPKAEFDEMLSKNPLAGSDFLRLSRVVEGSRPHEIKEIRRKLESFRHSKMHEEQAVALLTDLEKQLLSQRKSLLERLIQLAESGKLVDENPKIFGLYSAFFQGGDESEIFQLSHYIPYFLSLDQDSNARSAAHYAITVLNQVDLLKMPNGNVPQEKIVAALSESYERELYLGQLNHACHEPRTFNLLVGTKSEVGDRLLVSKFHEITDTSSITDLFNLAPQCLAGYSLSLNPKNLGEVFRIGDLVEKSSHPKLRAMFFNHLRSLISILKKEGEADQLIRIQTFLQTQSNSENPGWADAAKTLAAEIGGE